jgi:hypothetical protein
MDDQTKKDDLEAEELTEPIEVEEKVKAQDLAPTEVVFEGLATGKEPWKASGCASRLPLYGCMFGLVILIGFLMAGTSMMRRTVWTNMDRGRRAMVQSLPRNLPAVERQRTIKNLDRFRVVLDATDDPYPIMGEFMNRVRDILADGRVTVDEVGGLNVFLERIIDESGIPPMQLGKRMRNEELGMRNSRPAPRFFERDAGGWVAFLIPNS